MFRRSLILGGMIVFSMVGFSFADFQSELDDCKQDEVCKSKVHRKYVTSKSAACKLKDGEYKKPLQVKWTKGKSIDNRSFKKIGKELFYNVYVYNSNDIENGLHYLYSYNCTTKKTSDLSTTYNIPHDVYSDLVYSDQNYLVVNTNCQVGECIYIPHLINKKTKTLKDLYEGIGLYSISSNLDINLKDKNGTWLQSTREKIKNHYNSTKEKHMNNEWFDVYAGRYGISNITKDKNNNLFADVYFQLKDGTKLIKNRVNLLTQIVQL